MKIKVKQAVIVEGKYDKIRLSNIIDGVVIPVNGFSLYKDKETCELIKILAKRTGIIILTDSDSAGFQLRNRIKELAGNGEAKHVYIPDIKGKEKRKTAPSKQGLLGVEGVSDEILLEAFKRAGITESVENGENGECDDSAGKAEKSADPITKADLAEWGLSGGENSSARRARLLKKLDLPSRLSANMMLDVLNIMYSKEEIRRIADEIFS